MPSNATALGSHQWPPRRHSGAACCSPCFSLEILGYFTQARTPRQYAKTKVPSYFRSLLVSSILPICFRDERQASARLASFLAHCIVPPPPQLLLDSGGSLRCKTMSGMNPLMCAVQQRWHSVSPASFVQQYCSTTLVTKRHAHRRNSGVHDAPEADVGHLQGRQSKVKITV